MSELKKATEVSFLSIASFKKIISSSTLEVVFNSITNTLSVLDKNTDTLYSCQQSLDLNKPMHFMVLNHEIKSACLVNIKNNSSMEVLIVSKTHMMNNACVGGLILTNNRYIRLLNNGNYNQPTDTEFNVGDIWNIDFNNRNPLLPPHIEDVIITTKSFIRREYNIPNLIRQHNIIDWNGHINNLFGGLLNWTNSGSGFIPFGGQMPNRSVGFWIADHDLIRVIFDNKTRFRYPNGSIYRNISYVGYQDTIAIIPAGTILRVSLSRIFPPENSDITAPRGYYLQLSGWYIERHQANQPYRNPIEDIVDDLPF